MLVDHGLSETDLDLVEGLSYFLGTNIQFLLNLGFIWRSKHLITSGGFYLAKMIQFL